MHTIAFIVWCVGSSSLAIAAFAGVYCMVVKL